MVAIVSKLGAWLFENYLLRSAFDVGLLVAEPAIVPKAPRIQACSCVIISKRQTMKLPSRNLADTILLKKLNARRHLDIILTARAVATLVVFLVAPSVELGLHLFVFGLCDRQGMTLATGNLRDY